MKWRIGIALSTMAALLSACTEAPEDERTDERASAVIGAKGGTVQTSQKGSGLEIHAGALAAPVTITIDPISDFPSDPLLVPGTVFEFGPDGQ